MRGPDDTLERDLVEKVRAGNRAAFDQLAAIHLPRLLSLSRRMLGSGDEAQDALQNALASTWIARAKLDPSKPIAAYLTTVTLNKCRDRLRRRKAAMLLGLGAFDPDLPVASDAPDAESEIADRQALRQVSREIEHLPILLREAPRATMAQVPADNTCQLVRPRRARRSRNKAAATGERQIFAVHTIRIFAIGGHPSYPISGCKRPKVPSRRR